MVGSLYPVVFIAFKPPAAIYDLFGMRLAQACTFWKTRFSRAQPEPLAFVLNPCHLGSLGQSRA